MYDIICEIKFNYIMSTDKKCEFCKYRLIHYKVKLLQI